MRNFASAPLRLLLNCDLTPSMFGQFISFAIIPFHMYKRSQPYSPRQFSALNSNNILFQSYVARSAGQVLHIPACIVLSDL